jgi:hypothetical protein
MNGLVLLLLISALIWFWLDSRRAHEFGVGLCRHLCEKHSVILLDETVILDKLKLRRNTSGRIVFERTYRFEYSDDIALRQHGELVMVGLEPVEISIGGQRTLL